MCAQVSAIADVTANVVRLQTADIERLLDTNNQALADAINGNNALIVTHLDQVSDRIMLLVNTLVNLTKPHAS